MKTAMSTCITLFFLLIACSLAFAGVVPDPVLYLNAADNPAHPDAWVNLGTEGGESIGANSFDERRRTFNGSFAIVRAYDKALTEAEINQNISGAFAVDPADKLSTTWAKVKHGF